MFPVVKIQMFTMYTFPVIQLHHITTAGAQLYYAPAVATNNNYNYTMLLINEVLPTPTGILLHQVNWM